MPEDLLPHRTPGAGQKSYPQLVEVLSDSYRGEDDMVRFDNSYGRG